MSKINKNQSKKVLTIQNKKGDNFSLSPLDLIKFRSVNV